MITYIIFTIFVFLLLIINFLIKKSYWYQAKFGDALKFKNIPKDLQIVNLGSNSGKFSFDYERCEIKGMNWAVGPQTIAFDFKILQTFIPKIKKNGYVFLSISIFSSIKDNYKAKSANDKYYHFLPSKLIPGYSKAVKFYVELKRIFPFLFILLNPRMIITLLKVGKPSHMLEKNPMNLIELKADAAKWMEGWQKEFSLNNLNAQLPEVYDQTMRENRKILKDCIYLCHKNGLKPIIVLPPVSKFLKVHLTHEIKQKYIYDFINKTIEQTGVKLLDYMGNSEFSDPKLYFNSFFLNARGRKMFTKKMLTEIYTNKL